jgi:sigma-E factor negative regulatory protein RseB
MKLPLALCGLLAVVAANVYAEEDGSSAFDWLEVAAFAGHQSNYKGEFIYQFGNQVETSNIVHINDADGEYEKLESLDGPKREVILHGGFVWSYDHDKRAHISGRQTNEKFPILFPEQLSALKENYSGRLLGIERVAGFNAQVLLFQPKDNLLYTHKMWIDTDSGLLLKAAVLGDRNRIFEQYEFTHLQIGGDLDPCSGGECDLADTLGGAQPGTSDQSQAYQAINSGWVADLLPKGFKKTMEILRHMPSRHDPVTQIVYSDGLSAISIFIEPNDHDEDDVEGLSSLGAVNLYHKVMNENLITVVGEVPPRTVIEVAESVRYNGK